MSEQIRISVYFMWEWWRKHFHAMTPMPEKAGDNELAKLYLQRKRFLFEKFGHLQIGEEVPEMDGKYVNLVIKWGMDFIPCVLGAELTCQESGGYTPRKMDLDEILKLKPVDISAAPAGEWIIKRKDELKKRYGSAEQAIDLEGPANMAIRIRGDEFYIDLLEEKGVAAHLLEVVTETICSCYRFLGKEFKLDSLLLANCNVTLMSPKLYEDTVLQYDLRLANLAPTITGRRDTLRLHHCSVPVDRFIDVYKKIPNVCRLEASHTSDIKRICTEMPGVLFAAMVNPVELMTKPPEKLKNEISVAIGNGAREIDIWDIDPSLSPENVNDLLSSIESCCLTNDKKAVFDVIPICWDELEWAFPKYQSSTI